MWFVKFDPRACEICQKHLHSEALMYARTCATAVIVISSRSSASSLPHFNLPIYPKIQTGDGASRYNFGRRVCRRM